MKLTEKLNILQNNHFGEWLKTCQQVENELSDKQSMVCFCGRLATGLHERHCSKFRNKIIKDTVKRLEYLIIK